MFLFKETFLNPLSSVQNLAISLYGYNRKRHKYGSLFHTKSKEINESQYWTKEDLDQMQLDLFIKIMSHAYNTTTFYKKKYDSFGIHPSDIKTLNDIQKVPVITKEDVREHLEEFISNKYKLRDLVKINTSGSTGKPLTLYRSKNNFAIDSAFVWRHRGWAGITPKDKLLTLAGRSFVKGKGKPPYWRFNYADNQMLMSSYHISEKNISSMVEAINEFKPVYAQGYPSSLYLLSSFIKEKNLAVSPMKAIFTSSETLLSYQREIIEEVFQTKIFDYYGNGELVSSFSQCEFGNYHINSEYSLTEIIDNKIIGTSLLNDAMPLIRYEIGDSASMKEGLCSCGRTLPIIEGLVGRTADNYVLTPDGRRISDFNQILKFAVNAREIQIIQNTADSILVRVVPRNDFNQKDERDLTNRLQSQLGKMNIEFEKVLLIEKTKSGKYLPIINNL